MRAFALLSVAHVCAAHVVAPLRPSLSVTRGPRSGSVRLSTTDTPTQATLTYSAIGLGLTAQPIMAWSLYTLKTTGCGLPGGPFGLLGVAEGISYVVVVAFITASLDKRATTGSGLPAGPTGLLGAAEGLSFLSAAAGLAVLGFQLADYGYLPEAVPTEGGVCSSREI
jgi:hypothetical protein